MPSSRADREPINPCNSESLLHDEVILKQTASEQGGNLSRNDNKSNLAGSAVLFLLLLATIHFLVDTVAGTVSPLWPVLKDHLNLQDGGIFWLYTIWLLATSISQLFFGYLGDRFHVRWLLWLGPAAGIVCLSCIGLSHSPQVAGLLFLVGGLGIAAFHPEAAALAGSCLPENRSRAMSLFAIGGYFGQAIGPTYSGQLTHYFGLHSLAWGIIGGLAALIVFTTGLRAAAQPCTFRTRAPYVPLPRLIKGRHVSLSLLLSISTLRVIGAIGVPLALSFMLDDRGKTLAYIGFVQSGFMAGIGFGGLFCAIWMRKQWERPTLLWVPLVVTPMLVAIPFANTNWLLLTSVAASGLLIGVALPVQISIGQQMLPEGQRVASSITMGLSWGIGGTVVAAMMDLFQSWHQLEQVFMVFAFAAALSAGLSILLPKLSCEKQVAASI